MTTRHTLRTFGALVLIVCPTTPCALARTNSLTTGLSTSFDYDRPQYEQVTGSSQTTGAASTTNTNDDDYSALVITPLIDFVSDNREDRFELRAAPAIKYNLIDSQTDWDADLSLSAARSMTKSWQLSASDSFVRSDNHDSQSLATVDSGTPNNQSTTPLLAVDRGRSRYWQNTLALASEHTYGQGSLVHLGIDHTVLRNDESAVRGYEDYNRSTINVNNTHRFNSAWKTGINLSYIRGDFTAVDPTTASSIEATPTSAVNQSLTAGELSNDLREYRLLATVGNETFRRHDVSLNYTFIGTRYDETLLSNEDIHQMQLAWRHEISQQLNTTLGAGPSYEKTEGRDGNWGWNGIAEMNYLIRHGSFTFGVEKSYDVDNFSGAGDRGFVNLWDSHLAFTYKLFDTLTLDSRIAYRYEDHQTPAAIALDEYSKEQYVASAGIRYTFKTHYSAGLSYTFTRQNSERIGEDYDDHRLLLTLSWEQEWLRW
jgi:hypothetical protein